MPVISPTEYHGNQNIFVHMIGKINTDYYGLDTGTVVWKVRQDRFYEAPNLLSPHPIWGWLYMERREIDIEPGFAVITGEYAGIRAPTPYIFEASSGLSDEPIETHANFVTEIAGTASNPLNGALWVDPKNNQPSTDNDIAIFSGFKPILGGVRNTFAGIESYLAPQATMRATWMDLFAVSASQLGKINTPPFSLALPGNWILSGVSFQQRGRVYQNILEWRHSGRFGWNSTIY